MSDAMADLPMNIVATTAIVIILASIIIMKVFSKNKPATAMSRTSYFVKMTCSNLCSIINFSFIIFYNGLNYENSYGVQTFQA